MSEHESVHSPRAAGPAVSHFGGSAGSPRPVIELHIEEVVLHGFRPHDRSKIGDALERELTRLLSEPDALAALAVSREGSERPRIDAGPVSLSHDLPAAAVGQHLARAIYGGLRA